jgi:hypothetical protein
VRGILGGMEGSSTGRHSNSVKDCAMAN